MRLLAAIAVLLLPAAALPADTPPAVRAYPAPSGEGRRLTFSLARPGEAPQTFTALPARVPGGYVVVASRGAWEDEEWHAVVRALAFKRAAETLVYEGDVVAARAELARRMPRFVCFVARPEEAGRAFVAAAHRMMRALDDDPYTDALWGIVTGYSAADAAGIACLARPLAIRRAAGGTGIPLGLFDEGVWYDEGRKNHSVRKKKGGRPADEACPDDTTRAIVDTLNDFRPDLFVTSGHATERDWQIGYSFKNGQLRCRDGVLVGVDLQGNRTPVQSPNPKVYLAVGNCLMGHVVDRQAMALAWMGSAGVAQMVGYTVETWFGYGGWGVLDYFFGQPGRFDLAEAWYLNNQALIHRLESRFAEKARFDIPWGAGRVNIGQIAGQLGYAQWNDTAKENVGLLWDRDTVAFYGDPAWDARIAPHPLPWEQKLTEKRGVWTFEVKAAKGTDCGRPPAALLPRRVQRVEVLEGKELEPVITDNFILLPKLGKLEAGKSYRVAFRAAPAVAQASGTTIPAAPAIARRADVARALHEADENRGELLAALALAKPEEREAMALLIANMPARDLRTLRREFLVENVEWAFRARAEAPWGPAIPEALFLNDVLPYAHVNERRDAWRRDFYERFMPVARACGSAEEAVLRLNEVVFATLKVQYHATKRPKPDQSPYESILAGYASCTGLSILLADACRAVGIPARLAGTPAWTTQRGNHTWVEVWVGGAWHFVGAAEPGPLDKTWFAEHASKADPARREHRIYAASFRKTGTPFPLVWAPAVEYVWAEDVTGRYRGR